MKRARDRIAILLQGWLGHVLRIGIAGGLLYWLLRGGLLDLERLQEALVHHPLILLAGLCLYTIGPFTLSGVRWFFLLRAAGVQIPIQRVAKLHLTGIFFSAFLPGGTGGDLVKGWYLAKGRTREQASTAIATLVMDRVLGLLGLLLFAVIAQWMRRDLWLASPWLRANAYFYTGMTFFSFGAMLFFLYAGAKHSPLEVEKSAENEKKKGFFGGLRLVLIGLRKHPKTIWIGLFLSVVVHGALSLVYVLCAKALELPSTLSVHFFVAPTLTLANGLPLSPAGIGVGESAAALLYGAAGMATGGASIAALVHGIVLLMATLTAPAYLVGRMRIEPISKS